MAASNSVLRQATAMFLAEIGQPHANRLRYLDPAVPFEVVVRDLQAGVGVLLDLAVQDRGSLTGTGRGTAPVQQVSCELTYAI